MPFQPSSLRSDFLVSKSLRFTFSLYRYSAAIAARQLAATQAALGQYRARLSRAETEVDHATRNKSRWGGCTAVEFSSPIALESSAWFGGSALGSYKVRETGFQDFALSNG
jgi:hypothetical protein